MIDEINMLNPKVISLDIAFRTYAGNADDKSLFFALRRTKTLILPAEISNEGLDYYGREMVSVYRSCAAEFSVPNSKSGFVSAEEEDDVDRPQVPRQFIVWQKGTYGEDIYHHFSVTTAMMFDSLKTSSFIRNHERIVDVDYERGNRKFKVFSAHEVLKGKLKKEDIEGKIIMMGFLGPGNEDKFFTPWNSSGIPDMYGLEYLANVVAQVLGK